MRRRLWAGVCLLLWALWAPAFAQSVDEVETARAAAIRKLDLQQSLPAEAKHEPPPAWQPWDVHIPETLIWVGLGLGALFALWWLKDTLPQWWRRARQPGAAPDGGFAESIDAELPRELPVSPEAEALARQGLYAEAMHALLLQSLAELRERGGESFADSLTSREILRRSRLADAGRRALAELIVRVEWSYFGRHPAGAEDYAASRRNFAALAGALAGAAA